ncbi:molybdenum cofactor biosynthesis protein MoaE [Jatrophihabitans endophyticus]|uniref:molybdenum cofactor biosynthesis protein MoaE n=1 Tax=Jatrophihabitans endophyticus TaxID=1206085 RepID=UPI0026EE8295|nr:molybdenum cofactor biosynthesis protein MoaE [Jatrophihabitans endophyticus]
MTTQAPRATTGPVIDTAMVDDAVAMERFAGSEPAPDVGAVVTFRGVVRDHDGGRPVVELEYEGHPSAAAVMCTVAGEVAARHPAVSGIRMAHRTGLLRIGDCALFAEVGSAHRAEAFATCAELVEAVKATLPVWKRQVFADGTDEWVNSP